MTQEALDRLQSELDAIQGPSKEEQIFTLAESLLNLSRDLAVMNAKLDCVHQMSEMLLRKLDVEEDEDGH